MWQKHSSVKSTRALERCFNLKLDFHKRALAKLYLELLPYSASESSMGRCLEKQGRALERLFKFKLDCN